MTLNDIINDINPINISYVNINKIFLKLIPSDSYITFSIGKQFGITDFDIIEWILYKSNNKPYKTKKPYVLINDKILLRIINGCVITTCLYFSDNHITGGHSNRAHNIRTFGNFNIVDTIICKLL